jgi:hypothetical protein
MWTIPVLPSSPLYSPAWGRRDDLGSAARQAYVALATAALPLGWSGGSLDSTDSRAKGWNRGSSCVRSTPQRRCLTSWLRAYVTILYVKSRGSRVVVFPKLLWSNGNEKRPQIAIRSARQTWLMLMLMLMLVLVLMMNLLLTLILESGHEVRHSPQLPTLSCLTARLTWSQPGLSLCTIHCIPLSIPRGASRHTTQNSLAEGPWNLVHRGGAEEYKISKI